MRPRTSLCNALHRLLAGYVLEGGGPVTEAYVLEYENDEGFGEFV